MKTFAHKWKIVSFRISTYLNQMLQMQPRTKVQKTYVATVRMKSSLLYHLMSEFSHWVTVSMQRTEAIAAAAFQTEVAWENKISFNSSFQRGKKIVFVRK